MGKGQKDIEVSASPETVWATISNYGDLSWFPGITSTEMDGEETRVVTAGGHVIRERLLEMDHDNRLLRYSAIEGLQGIESHEASIKLDPSGDGCKITYTWEVSPEAAVGPMSNTYGAALDGMKSHFG
jgi:carbon monoxide dehydrogenase subunit G